MENRTNYKLSIRQTERYCEYCGDSFVAKRSTKRFCSERCRYLAFVSKTEETLPLEELTDQLSIASAADSDQKAALFPTLNVKDKTVINTKKNHNSTLIQFNDKEFVPHCSILLENVCNEDYEQQVKKVILPRNDWNLYSSQRMTWINIRMLSLYISLYNLIDRRVFSEEAIQELSSAFSQFVSHETFVKSESIHPFSTHLKSWKEKLQMILNQNGSRTIRLYLSLTRKEELLRNIYILRRLKVKPVKFTELKFGPCI